MWYNRTIETKQIQKQNQEETKQKKRNTDVVKRLKEYLLTSRVSYKRYTLDVIVNYILDIITTFLFKNRYFRLCL